MVKPLSNGIGSTATAMRWGSSESGMFDFTLDATSGPARAGTLTLPHGTGATLVLANTYHLHVRPGEQVVEKLGALHRFMSWDRPLLTDSGGFQVFSLEGFRRVRRRRGVSESRGRRT